MVDRCTRKRGVDLSSITYRDMGVSCSPMLERDHLPSILVRPGEPDEGRFRGTEQESDAPTRRADRPVLGGRASVHDEVRSGHHA
ncbi:hypothetical protein GCM10009788_54680 [Nocardioides humi]|uniref:Uncharacterized protein n=1 Tax=Nocardioides humi TaxID=449461 RepID=A0ABN2BQ40_9ACTN